MVILPLLRWVLGNKTIHIFSTHLLHTHQKENETQTLQVENLIKVLPSERAIVMGDFNLTPENASIQKMKKIMVDVDPESAPTWSVYPRGCRICNPQAIGMRLDYIFTSKDLKTHSFKVGDSKGSDHLPISVVVEV